MIKRKRAHSIGYLAGRYVIAPLIVVGAVGLAVWFACLPLIAAYILTQ